MSATGEATVEADGSASFENPPSETTGAFNEGDTEDAGTSGGFNETMEENPEEMVGTPKGIDPAMYLIIGVILLVVIYFIIRRKRSDGEDDFFTNLDGEKFNLKLPAEVEEYRTIKDKCLEAGWDPNDRPEGPAAQSNGPHRVLAQALMKRAIAGIPIVTHIQKESVGMNRLYAQSMCSVTQWRSFQAAEQLVSTEVEEVRAEADLIEPGWSQVIWRQAMQYHQMLKDRHEQEAKQAEAAARKEKEQANKLSPEEEKKAKELAAEKAAQELIKAEEREKQSKKSFNGGTMKKGFLDKGAGKKK